MRVPSGKVRARENFEGPDDHQTFELGPVDADWSVEVHAKTLNNNLDADLRGTPQSGFPPAPTTQHEIGTGGRECCTAAPRLRRDDR